MRIRDKSVGEQIQCVLSYVQKELVIVWKKNLMEDLENSSLGFLTMEKFLIDLKQEFGNEVGKVEESKVRK